MNSKAKKTKRIITGEIDAQLWENFKKLCKKNDSDASKELRKYIKEYVNNNKNLLDTLF